MIFYNVKIFVLLIPKYFFLQRKQPKNKSVSTLKIPLNPNNPHLEIFSVEEEQEPTKRQKTLIETKSPVKDYIENIDKIVKNPTKNKLPENDANGKGKRHLRMKFMGIPTSFHDVQDNGESEKFWEKFQHHHVQEFLAIEKTLKRPEDIKIHYKVPRVSLKPSNAKREKRKFSPFVKANPRGNDPKWLRQDKSLPWIFDGEIHANKKTSETLTSVAELDFEEPLLEDDESLEEIPKVDCSDGSSKTSLSSDCTNFTNDSGSLVMTHDGKILLNKLNSKKFVEQKSLVTAEKVLEKKFKQNPFEVRIFVGISINFVKLFI